MKTLKALIIAVVLSFTSISYSVPLDTSERILVIQEAKPNTKGSIKKLAPNIWEITTSKADNLEIKESLNKSKAKYEIDLKAKEDFIPNDPYYGSQWHLPKIQANLAWDTTCANSKIIAILDSGVSHPDIKLVQGYNFYSNNSDTTDYTGHGTKVAGAAAATFNNSLGIAGVAGCASVMPLRIADLEGFAYYSTVARAITYAADNSASVINVSYATMYKSLAVQEASRYAKTKGAIVVVSAGNTGTDDLSLESPDVIAVSATNSSDTRPSWSSFGNYVDISAPGENIYTTNNQGTYSAVNGTSFSSPITAGIIALMQTANPAATPRQLEDTLKASAIDLGTPGYDIYYGHGRVNAANAVNAIKSVVTPIDTTAPIITISSPTGTSVKGTVSIIASATDTSPYTLELYINSVKVQTSTNINYAWNTSSLLVGSVHIIDVLAKDSNNNTSKSTISVTIQALPTKGKGRNK